ncbi:transforming acidic coiled-coil-containing protein 3 [Heteronotia binoei]|uniref:transforming acidic coiled-coil-containing protein 3 n=1 Tax=Heteronotia binoei TaxID=13085 RepID=UPI002931DE43|nr:transforming acidic coiled-coil-containing protein 3 [Heteronotia binoei]
MAAPGRPGRASSLGPTAPSRGGAAQGGRPGPGKQRLRPPPNHMGPAWASPGIDICAPSPVSLSWQAKSGACDMNGGHVVEMSVRRPLIGPAESRRRLKSCSVVEALPLEERAVGRMSLQTADVENIGNGSFAETFDFLFPPSEATGRSSILCPSQKENVPPKGLVKNVKVTFQTPVRDLQTCRILSPDARKKTEVHPLIKDYAEALEDFDLPIPSSVCQKTVELDTAADTKDNYSEIITFQAGASEPPNSPVVNKTLQENEKDANTSKLESIKSEFVGTPSVKLSPGKLSERVDIKTPSQKPDSNNKDVLDKTEGESKTGTEESLIRKASSHLDEDISGDPDLMLLGGCKIQNSAEKSLLRIERTNVRENNIPAKAELSPIQQYSSPDESEAVDMPPEPQGKTEQLVTENQALAEAETQSEPSKEQEVNQSASLGDGDASLRKNHLMSKTSCGISEMAVNPGNEFRSPREILGMNMELDYLEQFGVASFKESAWRKQSLYLKFDPLLTESPKKIGSPKVAAVPPVPALSEQCTEIPPHEIRTPKINKKLLEMNLLGTPLGLAEASLDIPISNDLSQFSCAPVPTEAIIDVLKYSQKDMDAAVEKMDAAVQKLTSEVQEKQSEVLEWKAKYDKMSIETQEMRKILVGFEGTITQILEDSENQKEHAKKELQKVLGEKQQLLSELNSMEKSFADLFKRSEKRKEAIEGFQKNEEALKKCVEDYAARAKKEEQRYQALKAHAEEKLCQANKEIAEVSSKAKAEVMALQAALRKEQVRVQSLERLMEQKVKENDELTKICDDLISRMEKK